MYFYVSFYAAYLDEIMSCPVLYFYPNANQFTVCMVILVVCSVIGGDP